MSPDGVRRAHAADIDAIVDVVNRAYVVEAFLAMGPRTNARDITARMAREDSTFLVIDAAGPPESATRLAGSIFVQVDSERGYFGLLAVDPGHQKQGIGRRLVGAAEAHCRAAGCTRLELTVVSLREELPAFYDRLGYSASGVAPFEEPSKLTAHLVVMTKPLLPLTAADR